MPKFKVCVSREWTEYGEIEIDADNAEEARDIVKDMMVDGDADIRWYDSMDPGKDDIESVEEI